VRYKATVNSERYYPQQRLVKETLRKSRYTMRLRGYRLRTKAFKLFQEHDNIAINLIDSSMDDIHMKISYYKKIMDVLSVMLKSCKPLLNKNSEAEELKNDPKYENMRFQLIEYKYQNRRFLYKSEIKEFMDLIDMKLNMYDKFVTEITVNAGVALALLMMR
jgi:hypothetical protein